MSALSLLSNAALVWNTVRIGKVVADLENGRRDGDLRRARPHLAAHVPAHHPQRHLLLRPRTPWGFFANATGGVIGASTPC